MELNYPWNYATRLDIYNLHQESSGAIAGSEILKVVERFLAV